MANNFQTDFDQYNQVSDDSMLTHQNLLFAQHHFAQELNCGFSFYDESQGKQSVGNEINEFIRSDKNSLSLIIANGSYQQTPTHNSFSEGSHWTALNLKKLADGSFIAFYADSLQGQTTKIPKIIKQALDEFKIKVYATNCQLQTGNKCGDCALYNAIAMDKMSKKEISKGILKIESMSQEEFIASNRQILKKQFNKPSSTISQSSQPSAKPAQPLFAKFFLSPNQTKSILQDLKEQLQDSIFHQNSLQTSYTSNTDLSKDLSEIYNYKKNILKDFALNLITFANEDNQQKILPKTQGLLNEIQDDIVAKKPEKFIGLISQLAINPRLCNDQRFQVQFKKLFIEVKSKDQHQQSIAQRMATRQVNTNSQNR